MSSVPTTNSFVQTHDAAGMEWCSVFYNPRRWFVEYGIEYKVGGLCPTIRPANIGNALPLYLYSGLSESVML